MIEIRPAKSEEMEREKELWKLAFGDDDGYIDYFYQKRPIGDTLVLLEDGVLWTMLALFPVEVVLPDGKRLKSSYIYALATHPDARKKGFGRFILSYVDFYLKEQGMDCVTIEPAEAGLHRFFGTVGFSECFTSRKVEIMSYMAGKSTEGDTIAPATPAEYRSIRERLLEGSLYVSYDEDVLGYQKGVSENTGGGLYKLTVDGVEGCACAEFTEEETVGVKELLMPKAQMARAAALLAEALPAVRYHLRTPALWDGLPGSYPQAFAMIKWYDPALEKAWRDQSRGYMGLGFD
ncbi:MAG: GNAT family N-acetyltransferase [Clostridia bacterium]|nr:GNAT family N-acetyltransferase [Clostridia bacterium]